MGGWRLWLRPAMAAGNDGGGDDGSGDDSGSDNGVMADTICPEQRESRESNIKEGTGNTLVDRTTVASALHLQRWCDAGLGSIHRHANVLMRCL